MLAVGGKTSISEERKKLCGWKSIGEGGKSGGQTLVLARAGVSITGAGVSISGTNVSISGSVGGSER